MGVFVLGYLALVAVLGVASLYFFSRILARCRQKQEWFDYALLLPMTIVPFIYLTWPFLVGRLVYELQFTISSGLSVKRTVDASTDGYLLHDPGHHRIQGTHFSYHAYTHQAVTDLAAGRIAFFEGSAGFSGGEVEFPYIRVFLADKHSRLCQNYDEILQGLNLPEGKCLASEKIRTIESKYEIRGYKSHDKYFPKSVQVTERKTGEILSVYSWFDLDIPFSHSDSCPKNSPNSISPLGFISTTVLKDPGGKTLTGADFEELKNQASKLELHNFREIPPRELNSSPEKSDFGRCMPKNLGDSFETHKISLHQGDGDVVKIRIDGSNNTVQEVRVIVNNPVHRTVLSLNSHDPVVWNISRTPDSEIAGVVVTGYHGQAVLGVDRKTPVMISTQMYSPGINCSPTEMRLIRSTTSIAASGIDVYKKAVVVIGSRDFQESSLISSGERVLDNYAVQ